MIMYLYCILFVKPYSTWPAGLLLYTCVGCLPRAFVPATPVGQQLEVDCSQIHPTLRGTMQWRCVSDLTWDGDLSGCTFTYNAENTLALVSYRICSGTSEVQQELETIRNGVC